MENNDITKFGKIHGYDGEVGYIITSTEKYIFSKKDLDDNFINNDDLVEFYSNIVPFGNEKTLVARNIKQLKKSMINKK